MTAEIKERVVCLFMQGMSINHIVFMLDYVYDIDQVTSVIREVLRDVMRQCRRLV